MANTKLDRIERDIEKTRAKILEQQKKLKDLEAQKVEVPKPRVGSHSFCVRTQTHPLEDFRCTII